jgi:phosphotransferase system enzyme I (PtsP)
VAATLPKDAIIVARSMGAAELLDYPRDKLRGLVLEDGAVTSHVVIVARAMGIPVAGQMKGAVSMAENGDAIIVDGEEGIGPSAAAAGRRGRLCREGALPRARQELYRELRDKPSDEGRRQDRPADECRPAGRPAAAFRIGRGRHRPVPHRTAVHGRRHLPARRGAGAALPRRAGCGAGKPVTFRTIDIGGDKVLPYFKNAATGGEPGARLARDPADAGPAGPAEDAGARAAQGGGRPRAEG